MKKDLEVKDLGKQLMMGALFGMGFPIGVVITMNILVGIANIIGMISL